MSRSVAVIWSVLFVAGYGLMYGAYRTAADATSGMPSGSVLYVIEDGAAQRPDEKGVPVQVRFLAASPQVVAIGDSLRGANPRAANTFLRNNQEFVLLLPGLDRVIDADMLASGRLPAAGRNEVLAGSTAAEKEKLTVGNLSLAVVGVLRPCGRPWDDAYALAGPDAPPGLFDPKDASVKKGFLVTQGPDQKDGSHKADAGQGLVAITGSPRLARGPYYGYLAGMAMVLTAGSALLIGSYAALSRRIRSGWLASPLAEMQSRRKLLCGVHAAYFGLTLLGAVVVYEFPLGQQVLLTSVHREIESGGGPLAWAGSAYGSKNIPLAAVTTLGINFLLGSLAMITLPSLIVPGVGILLAAFRAAAWGVLLAPSVLALALGMLPHSGTLLLEGEGYILASFFALLVPIYLFSPRTDPAAGSRLARAVAMNLKGNLLVLVVLAVAASYEAVEVILQMRG